MVEGEEHMTNGAGKAGSRRSALALALLTGIVGWAASGLSSAGGCRPDRPRVLAEIEVTSCAPLDAQNAGKVSRAIRLREQTSSLVKPAAPGQPSSLRAEVAAHKRGVVIEAKVNRARDLQVDLFNRASVVASAWEPSRDSASVHFFYPRQAEAGADTGSSEAEACERFRRTPVVAVMLSASCECDTGPGPQGYCVIDEGAHVYDVPPEYTRYTR
jgi:hypothetical protein